MEESPKLILVGSGIKTISHLSLETKNSIENASQVLFLINEPALEQYIRRLNTQHTNLEEIYFENASRSEAYKKITDEIVSSCLSNSGQVCVVIYGHPTIFAKPGLDAVRHLENIGINTSILPGISTADCLFADLAINPGSQGCISIDSTEFLCRDEIFTPYSHLILWQPGMIGTQTHEFHSNREQLLDALYKKLRSSYPDNHPVILYEAAIYPGLHPFIEKIKLNKLSEYNFNTLTTIYIPPIKKPKINHQLIDELKIKCFDDSK